MNATAEDGGVLVSPPPFDINFGNYEEHIFPQEYDNGAGPVDVAGSFRVRAGVAAKVSLGCMYAVMMVVCGICDTLVVCVVLRFRNAKVRNTMNLLLANLAVSDLAVTLLSAPFFMDNYLRGTWIFGEFMCAAAGYIKNMSLYVSTNCLVAISIHRTLLTKRPHAYSSSSVGAGQIERSILLLMGAIWVTSAVIVLPTALYSTVYHLPRLVPVGGRASSQGPTEAAQLDLQHAAAAAASNGSTMPFATPTVPHPPVSSVSMEDVVGNDFGFCVEHWPVGSWMTLRGYCTFLIVCEFIIPIIIMVTCHSIIGASIFNRKAAGVGSQRSADSSRIKAFNLLVLIIVCFILCWLPFYAYVAYREWWEEEWRANENSMNIFYVVESIAMSNSMFNAIFNVLLNQNMREHAGIMLNDWRVTRAVLHLSCWRYCPAAVRKPRAAQGNRGVNGVTTRCGKRLPMSHSDIGMNATSMTFAPAARNSCTRLCLEPACDTDTAAAVTERLVKTRAMSVDGGVASGATLTVPLTFMVGDGCDGE